MDRKKMIWIFLALGSYLGSFIASLWGAGTFDISSVLMSAVGGFAGIWLGFQLGE